MIRARVDGYQPAWLDELCLSGEIVWGRFSPREAGAQPTRAALVAFARRSDLAWVLPAQVDTEADVDPNAQLSEAARQVLVQLRSGGAMFFDDLVAEAGVARGAVEDALWELVGAGRITGDGFAGLRALIVKAVPVPRLGRFRPVSAPVMTGRWALLRAARVKDPDPAAVLEAFARQLLRRWGVVVRELLAREARAPAWRDLLRVYRRLEMRGEIRGGRFVAGLVGEQFALPEALDAMRAMRRAPKKGEVVELSACDPLNLVGILLPGPRVPAHLGQIVRYEDGVPIAIAAEPAAIAG